MDTEVVYVDSPKASNLTTPRNERQSDDVAVVSSTSGYPVVNRTVSTLYILPVAQYKTDYHADVVEWCPDTEYNDIFIGGTYELQENKSECWSGDISLYQLERDPNETWDYQVYSRTNLQMKSGVFDLKWDPKKQKELPTFAVATANGLIELYTVDFDEQWIRFRIREQYSMALAKEGKKKPLSVDWSTHHSESTNLIVSDSLGDLNHLCLHRGQESVRTWKAHAFEAWTASFDCHDANVIYSGGDDCYLKGWDLRTNLEVPNFRARNHSMGVTTVTKNKEYDYLLASGSYDEHIFLWDIRKMKEPLCKAHIEGGGVWKLKWNPSKPRFLLAAAMHAGFHVAVVSQDSSIDIQLLYQKDATLAYGVDWCYKTDWSRLDEPKVEEDFAASCSFYDNLVYIWKTALTEKFDRKTFLKEMKCKNMF